MDRLSKIEYDYEFEAKRQKQQAKKNKKKSGKESTRMAPSSRKGKNKFRY